MPVKHQIDRYRTIGGVRYLNECDVLDDYHEQIVATTKQLALRHRVLKHPDGFKQLFIHPDDVDTLRAHMRIQDIEGC